MQLKELIIVLMVLISRICSSNILINVDKPNTFAALGDAAIRILKTCSATKTKTIALHGDFPEDFIKRLSAIQSTAFVSLHNRKRTANTIYRLSDINLLKRHKIDVLIAIASRPGQFWRSLYDLEWSSYDNPMALTLAIAWPPEKPYADCDGRLRTAQYFHRSNQRNHLNTILMCHHRTKGVTMYSYNPFTDKAPKPWQRIPFRDTMNGHHFHYFMRQYQDHEDNCKNLDYDKTHDLGRSEIILNHVTTVNVGKYSGDAIESSVKPIMITNKMMKTYIYNFIAHVNGTKKHVWRRVGGGIKTKGRNGGLSITQGIFQHILPFRMAHVTYPHGEICKFLVSQFRGHKSQLQKIFDVIDVYSWIGLCAVYLVTLAFLKYFFRQPLIAGILNLIRLTCNCGVVTSRPQMSSQIYMGCLLFVVVTMQGIFMGNLAALLTHDFPVRQVNSIQDLIDFANYKVYVHPPDQALFNNPVFKGRIISRREYDDCISKVQSDPMNACLEWEAGHKYRALGLNLHVSTQCVLVQTAVTSLPWRWPLKERLNWVLMWSLATDIMLPLDAIVAKKRLQEEESQEVVLEPRVMVFDHVRFAFNILGIGLTCALVCFIVELIVYRYNNCC